MATTRRHPLWYLSDGDVIFQVERDIYRFRLQVLARHAPFFDDFRNLPPPPNPLEGCVDRCPIILDGTKSEHFCNVLVLVYGLHRPKIPPQTESQWRGVLDLAGRWDMEDIKDKALCALKKMKFEDPIEQILICDRFGLPKTWAINAFNQLCPPSMTGGPVTQTLFRKYQLSMRDAERLGLGNVMLVYRLRERLRLKRTIVSGFGGIVTLPMGGIGEFVGWVLPIPIDERDIRDAVADLGL